MTTLHDVDMLVAALDTLAERGFSVPVIAIVGGVPIAGFVASTGQYETYIHDVLSKGLGFKEADQVAVIDMIATAVHTGSKVAVAGGGGGGGAAELPIYLHLRDATADVPGGAHPLQLKKWWRIRVGSVDALNINLAPLAS